MIALTVYAVLVILHAIALRKRLPLLSERWLAAQIVALFGIVLVSLIGGVLGTFTATVLGPLSVVIHGGLAWLLRRGEKLEEGEATPDPIRWSFPLIASLALSAAGVGALYFLNAKFPLVGESQRLGWESNIFERGVAGSLVKPRYRELARPHNE